MKNIVHITLAALVMLAVGCKQGEFNSEPTQGVGQEVVVELPALVVEQPAVSKSIATDQVETSRFGKAGAITITSTATEGIASEGEASKASWHEALTNVWVLQFASNGTRLQSRNVGSVAVNQPITTTLTLGTGTTIYVIANGPTTGLDGGNTYNEAAFLSVYERIVNAGGDAPRLSGKQTGLDVVTIEGKAQVLSPTGRLRTIQLRSNVASVKLDLDISKVVGATLASVELCKVAEKKYIVATDNTSDIYLDSWSSKASAPYSWLIPQNLQGTVSSISSYDQRTHANAPSNATYLRITLKYGFKAASFDLFLGESVKDFNVRHNYVYNIKLSIVGAMDDFEELAKKDDRTLIALDYTTRPANCYVTYPINGVYMALRFNALKKPVAKYVKGNSTVANAKGSNPASATDPRLGDDIVYQAGDYVQVVWGSTANYEDNFHFIVPTSRFTVQPDGVVTVTTGGYGTGNSVLAYKRADGTALWNYHIWGTDSNPFVTHATANTGGNVNGTAEGGAQARFMDRNLGALSATTAKPSAANAPKYFGLLYQYGHTTPFTGQGGSSTLNTYTQLYDNTGSPIPMNNIGGFTGQAEVVDNITTAIQNPRNWYHLGDTWNSLGEVALWSDYGTNKSIYDPCPYGYRVPKDGSWAGFTTAQEFRTAIDGGLVSFGTWWPATGYRGYSTNVILEGVGQYGWYWSSTIIPRGYRDYSYSFMLLELSPRPYDYPRGAGMAIRCVQEGY